MNLESYPLDKLFHFVAGIIPGFVALLIYEAATPGTLRWFFTLGSLGYNTKLLLVFIVAFIIGNSLTAFLNLFLGFIWSVFGSFLIGRGYGSARSRGIPPWQDPRWRAVLKDHLGPHAPSDSGVISEYSFKQRTGVIDLLPEDERPAKRAELERERINADIDDTAWERWYEHYHQVVLQQENQDFEYKMREGLYFNLETTSLYVVVSATFVPSLRHWWCLFPACLWLVIFVWKMNWEFRRITDKWLTLQAQIKFLSERAHSPAGADKPPQSS
ncbi:MAG: hypothetical protein LAO21_05815 [Acidobacteriia bacterium]|nr:hypothetical protein [Terriglobia bacterium]